MNNSDREIEVRFLEIDKPALIGKLKERGAEDLGEELLREVIFYGHGLSHEARKFIRLRQEKSGTRLTFKHHQKVAVDGTHEVEVTVDSFERAKGILEALGFTAGRQQEKKRHQFKLGEVMVDINTWPQVPTLVELEGPSEQSLKNAAALLGLDWANVVFEDNMDIIERRYGIPVKKLKFFTFSKFE